MIDQNHRIQKVNTSSGDIDLKEVLRVLWAGKWVVVGITFSVAVFAVVVVLMLPNIYRAEVLLAPNDQEAAGGLSALAAQYGGIASLAGINLGSGGADKTVLGLEILKSRRFISEFIERHDILVPLVAATNWNPESGQIDIDPDAYDTVEKRWVRHVSAPKKTIPTSQEAYEEFREILSIGQDKNTGFVTIAIEHYSPAIAKQWVDWLVDELNSSVMRQDVAEAEQAIEYLKKQIEKTSLARLQNVFYNLIEEQTKTVILANVSDEYLFKTLDPAVIPEMKARPKRSLVVVISTLLGAFFAIAVVLVVNSFHKEVSE